MKAANEAKSAGDATPVIFDTLKAAQELRKTGFEDRQAEAVVETISKAVSETVATKADLQLLKSEVGTLTSEVGTLKSEVGTLTSEVGTLRSEVGTLTSEFGTLRSEVGTLTSEVGTLKSEVGTLRSEVGTLTSEVGTLKSEVGTLRSEFDLLRSEFEMLRQSVGSRIDALENKIILKLGGLIVTMTFLLLAVGPFYFRWVMSLVGTP